tara:strand:+ start:2126 stop:3604 length:1479 start_codon:yes stop_codon:yes gene_type:complete
VAQLRFLGVSDLHSGAAASLATHLADDGRDTVPGTTSAVAAAFGLAVRALLTRHNQQYFGQAKADDRAPTVILLGDALDLAFSDRADAATCYLSWLRGLTGGETGYFAPDMVMLPGNHDHSLWTGARLAAEAGALAQGGDAALARATPALTGHGLPGPMMTALNRRAGFSGSVTLRYPNFALYDKARDRAVILHHGHFIDATYRAMTSLNDLLTGCPRPDVSAADLADENANWIDFGWSSFGQASNLSRDVVTLYSGLAVGSEAHHLRQRMARGIANQLAPHLPMGGQDRLKTLLRHGVLGALDATMGAYADEDRIGVSEALSPGGIAGLRGYIDGPATRQLTDELGARPDDLTFVFGHTHKPFVDTLVPDRSYPVIQVGNTGGWYLDSPRLNGREGAALLLIDAELNVVLLHCFATPVNGVAMTPEVRLVSRPDEGAEAFAAEIAGFVAADPAIWQALSATAAREYEVRQNMILDLLDASDHRALQSGGVM